MVDVFKPLRPGQRYRPGGVDKVDIVPAADKKLAQEEYGRWLSSVFGQVPQVGLGTYTFRDPPITLGRPVVSIGRQYAMRAAKQLEFLLTANGSSCFITLEEGSLTRRLHLHSLETSDPRMRELIHRQWGRRYGFESYRDVRSKMAVSLYVSKYVTKSDLPFWAGGPLFESPSHTGGDRPGENKEARPLPP